MPGAGEVSAGPAPPPAAVLRFLSTLRVPPGRSTEELLAAQGRALLAQPWPPVGAIEKRIEIGGPSGELGADLVLPASGAGWPVLVYVHGGGWDSGSPGTHRRVACELAARGFATVVPRYRLGPDHRHPAQLDDLDATIEWARRELRRRGAEPEKLVLAGDSAGAHLAAAAAIRRRLAGADDVGAVVLLCGIFDYHAGLPLVGPAGWDGDPGTQPLLDPEEFEALRGDPVVNPLLGAAHLPPAFVGAGSADPFAAQSTALFAALRKAGVAAELDWGEGLPHIWYLLPGLPEARPGLDRAAAWARQRLAER